MADLLRTFGFIYLFLSMFVAIIFFTKADVDFIYLLLVPIVIVSQSFMILLICIAISSLTDKLNKISKIDEEIVIDKL